MRPCVPSILLTAALWGTPWQLAAAAPPQVVVESAQVILGPGMAPRPGAPPFQPRLEVQFKLLGPFKIRRQFRFWRASTEALAALPKGAPIPVKSTGFLPLKGQAKALEQGGQYHLTTSSPEPWDGPQSLVVEVWVKSRLIARGSRPIVELNLPGTHQREEGKP